MVKKSFEEKIKDVGFWTFIFFILYLIVGYLLESLWLSKPLKLDDIYDLLKDGFGITAAFLAPVAAFVLFTDWRKEHREKIKDTNIRELIKGCNRLFNEAYELNYKINISNDYSKDDVLGIQALIDAHLQHINTVQICTNDLNAQSPELDNLVGQSDEILSDFFELGINLSFNFQHYKIINLPEDPEFKEMYLEGESKEDFIDRHYSEIGGSNPDSQDEDLYNIKVKLEKLSGSIASHLI